MADVGEMFERGVGVAVALEDDGLALIRVEKDFVLERARVSGADDVHRLFRQALPFLQLAGEELDAGNAFDFFHYGCRHVKNFRRCAFATFAKSFSISAATIICRLIFASAEKSV